MYELAELRDELDALALQVAAEMGVSLDHSVDSVKRIEELLGVFHDEFKKTHNDYGLNGIALEFAAHIVKVIEGNFGHGEWVRDHEDFGPDAFPYQWRGKELFPYAWCRKRIFDGPGEDVWKKFEIFVLAEA